MSLTKHLRTKFYNSFDLNKLDAAALIKRKVGAPVVSLTTVPKRISNLKPTLVSLLRQTVVPYEIQLNIGRDFFKGQPLPGFLDGLNVVKVHWTDCDRGPATKFIPTLERYQNSDQLIIVVDDDMYYSNNLVECLVEADLQSNGAHAYCTNGLKVPSNLQSNSRPSDKEIKSGIQRVAIIEGCGGYTLRPKFVGSQQLLNLTGAPTRSFFDDDFWLSGHLSRNGIQKFQISAGKRKSLTNTIESAISGDRAKLQTEVMNYFKSDWKPEEIHLV